MGNKIWENVIVFVLIGIAIIFITPIIQGMFFKSQISGAKTNAESIVRAAEVLYEQYSLERETELPFTVDFKEHGKYDLYENITKVANNQPLDTKGKKPVSGQVVIDKDGSVYARNIRYGNVICNMEQDRVVICGRKQ